jgi:hypothetical protein
MTNNEWEISSDVRARIRTGYNILLHTSKERFIKCSGIVKINSFNEY